MPRSVTNPLISSLQTSLGPKAVLFQPTDTAVYDCDAFTLQKQRPDAVVFPESTEQVADVIRLCQQHSAPVVARGAGTSLAGGCLPVGGGVVMMLTRMRRILEVNLQDRFALVEPGVLNLQLARALTDTGYHFAPDPSSQGASTIGGNVATNAGGPHTLKYGVTRNHLLGVEAVLADGSVLQIGPVDNPAELDLLAVLVGNEGTLAVITKVWCRLTRDPEDYRTLRVIFDTVDQATEAVSRIIAEGIIPAAMELMDRGILEAVEAAYHFGFPDDAEAVVVIELDGPSVGLDAQQERVSRICHDSGAREVLQAATSEQRALLWKCRKTAVGTVGRLSPSYCIQDGVVPRTQLPHILRRIEQIGRKHGIRIVNVAHAGDGNVHPILLFDQRDADSVARALSAGHELLEECLAVGGSVTAEHGIGVEKLDLMEEQFGVNDLEAMVRVRRAFNPDNLLSPGKVFPR